MAPPIDAREKLGTALRQALTQTPLSKISVSALTRAAGVTRQAFYYHFNSLSDLNAWVFREEITARLTTSSGEWLDAIEATMMWMHEHRDETASAMKTIEANDLWAFLASHTRRRRPALRPGLHRPHGSVDALGPGGQPLGRDRPHAGPHDRPDHPGSGTPGTVTRSPTNRARVHSFPRPRPHRRGRVFPSHRTAQHAPVTTNHKLQPDHGSKHGSTISPHQQLSTHRNSRITADFVTSWLRSVQGVKSQFVRSIHV